MSNNSDIWYGYLEAGEKSSPVLIDSKMDTGDAKTFYMYNLNSARIIEYKREIAEPKLRSLTSKEATWIEDLTKGYNKARKDFTTHTSRSNLASVATASKAPPSKPAKDPVDEGDLFDADDIDLDDDIDTDDEE